MCVYVCVSVCVCVGGGGGGEHVWVGGWVRGCITMDQYVSTSLYTLSLTLFQCNRLSFQPACPLFLYLCRTPTPHPTHTHSSTTPPPPPPSSRLSLSLSLRLPDRLGPDLLIPDLIFNGEKLCRLEPAPSDKKNLIVRSACRFVNRLGLAIRRWAGKQKVGSDSVSAFLSLQTLWFIDTVTTPVGNVCSGTVYVYCSRQ